MLVILAILAAILVPALLGWIDEARKKQYVLEARNIYLAGQAIADEGYAKGVLEGDSTYTSLKDYLNYADNVTRIADMAEVGLGTNPFEKVDTAISDDPDHINYVISGMKVTFTSQDGSTVTGTMADGSWDVTVTPAS